EEVMNLFIKLNDGGTTIVMVTHSARDAEYSTRIVNLFDGQIVSERY
ncbi:MAG: ABC transporter ATP-binding protein, partial [Bacteroidota bacterium]